MPPVKHTRTFRVRHYECDAYGHLNNANYVRYMEEAALDASAAVGYDKARYQALGRMWLARETEIEYLTPITYGQTVEVTTWVGDFRRVRSRRLYEFRIQGQDELVARAWTDWVFLDAGTFQPVTVPPEIVEAYSPGGLPDELPPREKFPPQPPQPAGAYTLHKRVEWRDIDAAGHMNNAVYLNYIEDCSTQVATHFGWPMKRIEQAGFAIIARRHRIEYLQPALLDDELAITTWVSDVKRSTAFRHYTVHRVSDNALLARARTLWVWVDVKRGRPMRIPQDFLQEFASNITQTEPETKP